MFISYAAHTRFHPFLDPMMPDAVQKHGRRGALASGVQLIYVRGDATRAPNARPCVPSHHDEYVFVHHVEWPLQRLGHVHPKPYPLSVHARGAGL